MYSGILFQEAPFKIEGLYLYQAERHHAETKFILDLLGKTMERVITEKTYPDFWPDLYDRFLLLVGTIENNQRKEETIFFPFVLKMLAILQGDDRVDFPVRTKVQQPIDLICREHQRVLKIMDEIKELTHNYSLKQIACGEGKICLAELFNLHQSLEKHFFLEENILFEQVFFMENCLKENNPGFLNNIV